MEVKEYIEGAFNYVHKKNWKPYAAVHLVLERFPIELSQEHFTIMGEELGFNEYWAIKQYEGYSGKKSPLKEEYASRMLDKEILEDTNFTGDWFKWDKKPPATPDIETPPEDGELPF